MSAARAKANFFVIFAPIRTFCSRPNIRFGLLENRPFIIQRTFHNMHTKMRILIRHNQWKFGGYTSIQTWIVNNVWKYNKIKEHSITCSHIWHVNISIEFGQNRVLTVFCESLVKICAISNINNDHLAFRFYYEGGEKNQLLTKRKSAFLVFRPCGFCVLWEYRTHILWKFGDE